MKLKTLLDHHFSSQSPHQLKKSFGDGYLLQHNSLYRIIRRKTIELGFQYSDKPNEFYAALSLSQLETILRDKIIPYSNNVEILAQIEAKIPHQLEWDHLCDNLKKNYLFHESCHAVARECSAQLKTQALLKENTQARIALMLLEEAFANTCELLAVSDATVAVHRIFYDMNSYICMFEDRTHFKNAQSEINKNKLFKFILYSYYHAHFLNEKMNEQDLHRCLRLIFKELPERNTIKTLQSLGKNAFALNPRFRYATSSLYLRLNGVAQEAAQAFQFDHLKIIEENLFFQNLVEKFSKMTII